jgi:hypothetical protein
MVSLVIMKCGDADGSNVGEFIDCDVYEACVYIDDVTQAMSES